MYSGYVSYYNSRETAAAEVRQGRQQTHVGNIILMRNAMCTTTFNIFTMACSSVLLLLMHEKLYAMNDELEQKCVENAS